MLKIKHHIFATTILCLTVVFKSAFAFPTNPGEPSPGFPETPDVFEPSEVCTKSIPEDLRCRSIFRYTEEVASFISATGDNVTMVVNSRKMPGLTTPIAQSYGFSIEIDQQIAPSEVEYRANIAFIDGLGKLANRELRTSSGQVISATQKQKDNSGDLKDIAESARNLAESADIIDRLWDKWFGDNQERSRFFIQIDGDQVTVGERLEENLYRTIATSVSGVLAINNGAGRNSTLTQADFRAINDLIDYHDSTGRYRSCVGQLQTQCERVAPSIPSDPDEPDPETPNYQCSLVVEFDRQCLSGG